MHPFRACECDESISSRLVFTCAMYSTRCLLRYPGGWLIFLRGDDNILEPWCNSGTSTENMNCLQPYMKY